nr:COX15/CtaA family protein [Hyphomonas sp. Mor2]
MPDATSPDAARWMRRWLILIGLMVYAMILIGGATRLTDSGLSITEWEPIKGALPPFGEGAWLAEFEKYKQTAEFQQQNYNMTMGEFQYIYWWEWGHRLFGRLIGLVAIAGFVWFAAKRWMSRKWVVRLAVLIALGGLQGFIGWWMVASGIGDTDRLDVAPYRLMTHFGLALLIIAITAWYWLDLGEQDRIETPQRLRVIALALLILTSIQMLSGALVAGLDAGRTYTDWPLMAGELIPGHYLDEQLGLRSLFEGRAATQFNHRFFAYTLLAMAVIGALLARGTASSKGFHIVAGLVTAQAIWGIITLVNAAPLPVALVHQGLGVVVLLAAVWLVWVTRPERIQSGPSSPDLDQ